MEDTFLLDDLIPNREGAPWTRMKAKGGMPKLEWETDIKRNVFGRHFDATPPLKTTDFGEGSLFSMDSQSETSITLLNKDLHPFFYKPDKIICIYNDAPKNISDVPPSDITAPDYTKFITSILGQGKDGVESAENVQIAEGIIADLHSLNKPYEHGDADTVFETYYENLKGDLLKIIDGVSNINLIITVLPKKYEVNKVSILVGSNFNIDYNTVGLNLYSEKYYERTAPDVPEKLDINLLTLLVRTPKGAKDFKFNLDFNLKKINDILIDQCIAGEISPEEAVPVKHTTEPETESKRIELLRICTDQKITDDYFSDWHKIEIDQIKNKNFNTFLLEPKTSNNNRKLLSYSKDIKKPSRFAGYFRQLDETECEIIWEPEWEVKYITYDDVQNTTTDDTVPADYLQPDKIHDVYSEQVDKLNKLIHFENEITKEIEDYKMYNIEGDSGNCFFYSFANSLIELDIINFEEDYPELIQYVKFEKLQKEDRIRPLYTKLSDALRILAHDILKKSFDILNTKIKNKIDQGDWDGVSYPSEAQTADQKVLQDLFNQRLSIVGGKVSDTSRGHAREIEIKIQTDAYLQKLKRNKFWGSNLEFEALSAFFNINGKILTMSKQSKLIKSSIDKNAALIKFSLDGIQLDNKIDPLSSDDTSDKTIYLSLIDGHFISTIPWGSFRKNSYNYLFQNNELAVSINYPKGTYNKMKVSDFHIGDTKSELIDNTFLEKCHNYIQWLFPNMKISEQAPSAQRHIYWNNKAVVVPNQLILNSDDVKFIKSMDGDSAKINSIKSLITMMKFFGFKFIVTNDDIIRDLELTSYPNFERQMENIKLERLGDEDQYKERFLNLLEKTHNYSRITRILKYFNAIGLPKLSKIIVNKLTYEIEDDGGELKDNSEIQRSLTKFWKNI